MTDFKATAQKVREGAEQDMVAAPLTVTPDYNQAFFLLIEERIAYLEFDIERQGKQAEDILARVDRNRERIRDLRGLLQERLAGMGARA